MSKDNDFSNLLEKIYLKVDSINTLDEADLLEFKNKVRDLDTTTLSDQTIQNFNNLAEKLVEIEEKNNSLKDSISELNATSTSILDKLSMKDEYSAAKLEGFLTDLAFQVQTIRDGMSSEKSILASDVIGNISELKNNSENINQHLENLSNIQNLALTNAEFEEYQRNSSLESLIKIKEELAELHENLSSQIKIILDDIFKQESEGPFNDKIVAIKDSLENLNKESIEQTSLIVQEIKANFTSEKYIDCLNKISTIYDSVSKVDKWLSQFGDSIDATELSDKIDVIYDNVSVLNEWASRLDNINKQVNQLSEKSEKSGGELEEVVAKVDVIYDSISLMNDWALKIDNVTLHINDIKEKLENLANDFNLITTSSRGDVKEYIYTLLDIESDFAKLHCLIDDSNKTADNEIRAIRNHFEAVQEDIASISKRTNKLIITSDSSNKSFMQQVENLKLLLDDLQRKTIYYNPLEQTAVLDKKLSTIKQLTVASFKSNQVVSEAFMHLGEWIDSTGDVITDAKENLNTVNSNLDSLNTNVNSVKDCFDNTQAQLENIQIQNVALEQKLEAASEAKTAQLESLFAEISDQFQKQEEKIVDLESKIVRLEAKIDDISNKDEDSEIKSVLDFIASQMIAANENAVNNKVLSQKMETVEHQLGKFEKNIARLVSYLDED